MLVSGIFSRMIFNASKTSVVALNCNVLLIFESIKRTLTDIRFVEAGEGESFWTEDLAAADVELALIMFDSLLISSMEAVGADKFGGNALSMSILLSRLICVVLWFCASFVQIIHIEENKFFSKICFLCFFYFLFDLN